MIVKPFEGLQTFIQIVNEHQCQLVKLKNGDELVVDVQTANLCKTVLEALTMDKRDAMVERMNLSSFYFQKIVNLFWSCTK